MTTTELLADIPLSTAIAAHAGSSFTPEKRGDQCRENYAAELMGVYETLSEKCRNDSERSTLASWWPRFRSVMRQLHIDYLHSQSRCMSTMIAGPSNFPVRRMEKRNRWAHNKLEHLLEVKARMLKRIHKDLRPELRPIMSGDSDALQRLRANIEEAEKKQETMKVVNAAHKAFLKDPASLDTSKLSDSIKGTIRNYKPAYSWEPHPFAPFELTNNNANIRRMKERYEVINRNQARPAIEAQGELARFEDCPADNRVRIFFPGKPDEATRSRLKSKGFRWSPTIGAWQAYRHDHTIQFAMVEAGITAAQAE